MKQVTIAQNDANQRVDKFLTKTYPNLPQSMLYKAIRKKDTKVNGKRCEISTRLQEGDVLQLYINDEFFDKPSEENMFLTLFKPRLTVVYEDEHLLLADKPQGMVVHADETEKVNTLINHIQAYLYQKREWNPRWENAFAPALCNRIDRNTGGIVIAAKTAMALRVMNQKIKDREIDKRYLAIVEGTPKPKEGSLKGYLFKDAVKNRVFVTDSPKPGAKTCQTNYKTLAARNGLSLVECELITGRTHQIRAQFAHAGHPLLGDGKYGKLDKRYDRTYQALYSYRLTFLFTTDSGPLEYLNGKCFQVEKVDFVEEYFPGFEIGEKR